MSVFDKFFERYSYRFPKGYPDFTNKQDILILEDIFNEIRLFEDTFYDVVGGSKLEDDIFVKLNAGENFNVDVEDVIFVRGSGKSYTPQSTDKTNNYTLSDIRKIIDEFDKPIYLTYTDNILKLRTPFGVRILQAGVPSKVGSTDFKRLIALNKLGILDGRITLRSELIGFLISITLSDINFATFSSMNDQVTASK